MSPAYNEVLVVDDEKVVCQNCEKILREEGFSVTTALSGEECLELIKVRKYDAVILDLKMPDISGMEILKVIKEKMPNTAVIMITGYSSAKSAIEAMKLGAADFVPKPFTPDELSVPLKEALKRREVVAGEGAIAEPPIKEAKLEEEIKELKYEKWSPDPLKHANFSEWMGVQTGKDETARIVLNDLFFKLKGRVKYIDLPQVGEQVDTDNPSFRIFYTGEESSLTQMEEFCSPVSGKVIEVNPLAIRKINTVNEDPFNSGWLVRIWPYGLSADLKGLESRKILIADDDEKTHESLIKYFKQGLYNICKALDLQDLAEGVKNKRYDVAILGKNVYGTQVYNAAEQIRSVDENLPIIVVTDDDSPELAGKVREHNIFYYAMKPLDKAEIDLAVRNAFMKIELKKRVVEKPQKFYSSRFIKSIEVVNHSGKHVAIVGLGNIFNEDFGIGQNLVDRLKKINLPVDLNMDRRELYGKELVPYIEKNEKIIIINGIEMGYTPGDIKKFYHNLFTTEQIELESKPDIRINQIGYPEVVHWLNATGMDPEFVVIGIQTNIKERFSFSMEQNGEVIDEVLSEVQL